MTRPGRENVAELSRQCRALVARQAQLPVGSDPGQDPVIRELLAEVTQLPVPHHSLQFMAAMVVGIQRRHARVMTDQGKAPMRLGEAFKIMAEEGNTDADLLQGCFAVLEATSQVPRNDAVLANALAVTGNRWGVSAHLTLSHVYLRFARGVVDADSNVRDLDHLLGEVSLKEELDLMEQGED